MIESATKKKQKWKEKKILKIKQTSFEDIWRNSVVTKLVLACPPL